MSQTCAICLDGSKADHTWVAIPECGHVFHNLCVYKWTNTGHDTCPNCKEEFCSDDVLRVFLNLSDEGAPGADTAGPSSPTQVDEHELWGLRDSNQKLHQELEQCKGERLQFWVRAEKLQAKANEDQQRIERQAEQARVRDCTLASALQERDHDRRHNESLQEIVKKLRERNEILEGQEMQNAILNDISLDRSALAKLTRGKDTGTVIMTLQKVVDARNMECNRFMEKVSLSCAAQRKAEQKVQIQDEEIARLRAWGKTAEGEIARLSARGKTDKEEIARLRAALKEEAEEKERAQLKQAFQDEQPKGAERGYSHRGAIPTGSGKQARVKRPRTSSPRTTPQEQMRERAGNGSPAYNKGSDSERNKEPVWSSSEGDLHFDAEESEDEAAEKDVESCGGLGQSATSDALKEDGKGYDSEGEARVYPTAFVFEAEEEEETAEAIGVSGQVNPEVTPKDNDVLEEVDGNAAELDGLRIRKPEVMLPSSEATDAEGNCGRASSTSEAAFGQRAFGRRVGGSSLVAAVRKNIYETKKPKFGYKPLRPAVASGAQGLEKGESVLGKRPSSPFQLPATQRVKAPTTSLESAEEESYDSGERSSGLRGRGAPESQLPGTSSRSQHVENVGKQRVTSEARVDDLFRRPSNAGLVSSSLEKSARGSGASGILGGTTASGRGSRGHFSSRPPLSRLNRTAKVTDFFGKK